MKILLINPRFPESLWSFQWILDEVRPNLRAVNPPLGLATLAALCPDDWEIEIIDENVERVPFETDADIVGVAGMTVQHDRQMQLVEHFQRQGCLTIVGGSYASLCPEAFEGKVDVVVSGEAEYIWPQFCRDLARGEHKPYYREDGTVELTDSPTPRFDLLKLERYRMATLQFSRGCPFQCEFCDIIVMFGRKPRVKSPEQIGLELDALRERGMRDVFFTDDNFIGHRPKAKALLSYLKDYQARYGFPFRFGTEASTDLAAHDDLMAGMRDSGFDWVFLGIETPDVDSLAETKKHQNTRDDLLDCVHRIYSFGLDIMAGFIVGFDNDTADAFRVQKEFLQASGIQMANVSMLQAMPKTPLYERLEATGRLRGDSEGRIDVRLSTNFEPMQMSYDELVSGYRELYLSLYDDDAIAARIQAKNGSLRRPKRETEVEESWLGPAARIALKGILAGGPARVRAALRAADPSAEGMAQSLVDWGFALNVRSYLDRHFQVDDAQAAAALTALTAAMAKAGREGKVSLEVVERPGATRRVTLTAKNADGLRALARESDRLLALLKHSPVDLAIDLRGVRSPYRSLSRILKKLRPYGARVFLVADAAVLETPEMEIWRFRYAMPPMPEGARRLPAPTPTVEVTGVAEAPGEVVLPRQPERREAAVARSL